MKKAIFEILRTGTFRANSGLCSFTEQDLKEIRDFYSKDLQPANLVIGHPEDDKPEYGKVLTVYLNKGHLFAEVEISNELVEKIQNGEIESISSGVYFAPHSQNPVRGLGKYLKHVGFLEKGIKPAVGGMMHPLASVAHIDVATLSGDEQSFVFLSEQSDKVDINLLQLHEKACYFERVLDISYSDALDLIREG
ncbi:hypothetical protein B0186_05345 [Canicola haemoglobinophilus]|uniref:Hypothetical bacteriophage protein n=1 Tax=Canicola haemoglobinophilus TaxID=733 RepID=A0A1V4B1M2_9PAST|nr:hypothetical protein [Canicola haemoglobinophilus]OOS00996.1 hypothetical protein B0186_05345 [Canicola haemoglobinophilus]STO54905.1 hypothetical bacteriophage protein [Canicola haemoglobinophilus]STO59176.1 hypothetical bacteriophage protein [Canicola haemoglobinophilus]STO69524.1 hypothetical bacteriophage protein [Canicola haemoglobinophilus]